MVSELEAILSQQILNITSSKVGDQDDDRIKQQHILIFALAVVLFCVAVLVLIGVLLMLRRNQQQIDAKLFNFGQASKSRYGDDSFI